MKIMSLTQDRQGYIGDLTAKTLSELKDLLDRKEKLLSNRSLLQKLPDKGKKIQEFVQKVKELIANKSQTSSSGMDKTSDDENMIHQGTTIITKGSLKERETNVESEPRLSAISKSSPDSTDSLSVDLQEMSLGTMVRNVQTGQSSVNAYEKIIQRDSDSLDKEVCKFMPHRSLKAKDKSSVENETLQTKMESHIHEESAVYPPQYKHQKSKLISLQESAQLMEEQQKRNEKLAIERATMRLLRQSSAKMEVYCPPSTDMNYREPDSNEQVGLDSDDDCDGDL